MTVKPTSRLEALFETERPEWEQALREAEAELSELRVRENELQRLIHRARVALGLVRPEDQPSSRREPTLHSAMAEVLKDHADGLTAPELLSEINQLGLYTSRNGSAVPLNQIHARASNYRQLFEKREGRIRLRPGIAPPA
jgi:hypothetical protein